MLLLVLGLLGCANERVDTHPVTPERTPVRAELAAIVRSADAVAVLAIRKMERVYIPDSYTLEKVFTGTIRRPFRLPERFAVGGEITFGYVQFSREDVNETHVEGGWPFTESGLYLVALRRWNQADFGPVPNKTIQAGWKPTAAYTFVSTEKTCWWPADSQEARFVEAIIAQQPGAKTASPSSGPPVWSFSLGGPYASPSAFLHGTLHSGACSCLQCHALPKESQPFCSPPIWPNCQKTFMQSTKCAASSASAA